MTDAELVTWGRRAWAALEAVHVPAYFSAESREELKAWACARRWRTSRCGRRRWALCPPRWSRRRSTSSPPRWCGSVVPECWSVAAPEQVLAARHRAAERDPAPDARPCGGRGARRPRRGGRAGAHGVRGAAHRRPPAVRRARRRCPGPTTRFGQLWLAATLLREHRGDGHVAALVTHDLDPVEAMVTSLLAGSAVSERFLRRSRGWTDDEWLAATQRLRRPRAGQPSRAVARRSTPDGAAAAADGRGGHRPPAPCAPGSSSAWSAPDASRSSCARCGRRSRRPACSTSRAPPPDASSGEAVGCRHHEHDPCSSRCRRYAAARRGCVRRAAARRREPAAGRTRSIGVVAVALGVWGCR